MLRSVGVFRIDAANSLKILRVLAEDREQVRVIKHIVTHLDDDGFGDTVGLHQFEEHLGRLIVSGVRRVPLPVREAGVFFVDVNVGIENSIITDRKLDWRGGGAGSFVVMCAVS